MSRGVIASVRDIVPIRPLTRAEALQVAERQATRFLELVGIGTAPVSERLIEDLPRVEVLRHSPSVVSGATEWIDSRWVILLNAAEPITRQRFSLAHELKHVLDNPFIGQLYQGLPEASQKAWIEHVCDFFAACLLMPRPWVKQAYGNGIQAIPELARAFDVSPAAMQVRLSQMGLIGPTPRCDRPDRDLVRRALAGRSQRVPSSLTATKEVPLAQVPASPA